MGETSDLMYSYADGKQKDEYYTNSGRKVGDFCLGFFGIWIVMIGISTILSWFSGLFGGFTSFVNIFYIPGLILDIVFVVFGITLSFRKGRRYIGIGIISSALVPLLVFGACLIVLSGLNF